MICSVLEGLLFFGRFCDFLLFAPLNLKLPPRSLRADPTTRTLYSIMRPIPNILPLLLVLALFSPPSLTATSPPLLIIGCGPAGLQAGLQASKLNISYLILEQTAHCGSFFDTYPRLGKLISFNKPNPPGPLPEWNQDDYDDYKLRFDWHTLLASPLPPFPTLTNQFYPDADIFRSYLQRSSQTLNIVFEIEVSQVTKNSVTLKKNGTVLEASAVILSTGMTPKPLSESESAIYNYTFPNADHYTYESAPLSCSVYESKHVFIYGSGNAANELSNHVIQNCAAMRTWVLGRRPIKSSFLTQYVGDVRSGNMLAVESYKLKSLDAVFEGKDYTDITLYQHIKMLEHGYGVKPTTR